MADDIADRLQGYLAGLYPGAQLTDFQFLISGFESDIYTFTFHSPASPAQPLILRVYPGEGVAPKLLREVDGLRRLHQVGFPVAAVLTSETDPAVLGKPFTIMERLAGKVLWPLLYQVSPAQADRLLDRFGGLMARLHHLDWRPFTDQPARYEAHPVALLDDLFAASRALYAKFDVMGFAAVVDWLNAHKSALTVQPAVVHLDFHANNVFLCDDDHLAVIDWTQIGVADYRIDLTWTLMIMGDFGQPDWRARILQAYQLEAGHLVDDLDYFSVISDTKLLASTLISIKSGPAALGLRPETAASAEQEIPTILRLSRRIKAITGITIPEVEAVLRSGIDPG